MLVLCACSHNYLSVEREYVDRETLASSFVGSPDPNQKNPPTGTRLWLHWSLPGKLYEKDLTLTLWVIYNNLEEEKITFPIKRYEGWHTYSLLDQKFKERGGLLTYRADITNTKGEAISSWKQQMWFTLLK